MSAGYSTLQRLPAGQQPKYKPFLAHVHGVLYQVNKEDMRKLQKREGGYVLTEIEVILVVKGYVCSRTRSGRYGSAAVSGAGRHTVKGSAQW